MIALANILFIFASGRFIVQYLIIADLRQKCINAEQLKNELELTKSSLHGVISVASKLICDLLVMHFIFL